MATGQMQNLLKQLRKVLVPRGDTEGSDWELLARFAASHDTTAFEVLAWRHHRMVSSVCGRILRDSNDVEDAFQATFVVLARKAGSIRRTGSLSSWLFGVARRVALEASRRSRLHRADRLPVPLSCPEPCDVMIRHELQQIFDEELGKLPEKYRSPVVICYLEGRTYEEAGQLLGCSKGTVSTRLTRARELLRKRLAGRGLAISAGSLAAWLCATAASAGVSSSWVARAIAVAKLVSAMPTAAGTISPRVMGLTEGMLRAMLLTRIKRMTAVVLLAAMAVCGAGLVVSQHATLEQDAAVPLVGPEQAAGSGGLPPPGKKAANELFEDFDLLSPAERWQRIDKNANVAKELGAVVRGDLVKTVVARGTVESARPGYVICTVRGGPNTTDGTLVKWVVEDGAKVKKGDLVVELDASARNKQLKHQKSLLDAARAGLSMAKDDLALVRLDNEASILGCEIEIRAAELKLKKKGDGEDVDETAILKLRLDWAKLNLARAKALAQSQVARAQSAVDAKKAIVEEEETRVRDIEQQIQACRLVAPHDGRVIYFVPEGFIGGSGAPRPIIHEGMSVREGQKLLVVADLTQMVLNAHIPEALVSGLRDEDPKEKNAWQSAQIHVDAYPNRVFKGHVKSVDTVAMQSDWFAKGVKNYKTVVSIDDKPGGLLPGMSAEVTIDTARAVGVLQVPLDAVVRAGSKSYCYVKRGNEVHKTAVVPGVVGDGVLEINMGLTEGDEILRDAMGLMRRLKADVPPANPKPKQVP